MTSYSGHSIVSTSLVARLFQYGLHHFVTKLDSLRESRREVVLDALKTVAIGFKIPKRDAVRPGLSTQLDLSFFQLLSRFLPSQQM